MDRPGNLRDDNQAATLRLVAALREAETAVEEGDVYEEDEMKQLFEQLER